LSGFVSCFEHLGQKHDGYIGHLIALHHEDLHNFLKEQRDGVFLFILISISANYLFKTAWK
jgi:hypothetical protein